MVTVSAQSRTKNWRRTDFGCKCHISFAHFSCHFQHGLLNIQILRKYCGLPQSASAPRIDLSTNRAHGEWPKQKAASLFFNEGIASWISRFKSSAITAGIVPACSRTHTWMPRASGSNGRGPASSPTASTLPSTALSVANANNASRANVTRRSASELAGRPTPHSEPTQVAHANSPRWLVVQQRSQSTQNSPRLIASVLVEEKNVSLLLIVSRAVELGRIFNDATGLLPHLLRRA